MLSAVRAYAAEPAVPDPPRRGWGDWALVGAASVSAVLEASWRHGVRWPVLALAVCLVTVGVLLIRRTRPLLAVAVGFGVTTAFNVVVWLTFGVPGGLDTGAVILISLYALARWGSGRHGLIGAPIVVATAVIGIITGARSVGDVIGGSIVLMLPIVLGLLVRSRSSIAQRRLETARARERERLARDLHDTVAHHVSAIAVQAQAGRAVAAARPRAALDALEVIEREASRTLAEMRAIVGALRADEPAELAPQPGVADIARLAADQPVPVSVRAEGEVGELSPAVDAALYRIAQEALTNAVRHGRGLGSVRIDLARDREWVTLTVEDDGAAPARPTPGGFGLAGMAERVTLLGGTFRAGPSPTGPGWRVVARLPIGEAPA